MASLMIPEQLGPNVASRAFPETTPASSVSFGQRLLQAWPDLSGRQKTVRTFHAGPSHRLPDDAKDRSSQSTVVAHEQHITGTSRRVDSDVNRLGQTGDSSNCESGKSGNSSGDRSTIGAANADQKEQISADRSQAQNNTAGQAGSGLTKTTNQAVPVPSVGDQGILGAAMSIQTTDVSSAMSLHTPTGAIHGSEVTSTVILPSTMDSEEQANVARVVRGLTNVINQRGGAVTLRLHPPELGVVRIELAMTDGQVRAAFHAEHESVRTLLNHQIHQLRHALESQGLVVERLTVHAAPWNNTSAQEEQGEANDGRSRGGFGQSSREQQGKGKGEMGTQDDFQQAFEEVT